jgi:hypothetical protein
VRTDLAPTTDLLLQVAGPSVTRALPALCLRPEFNKGSDADLFAECVQSLAKNWIDFGLAVFNGVRFSVNKRENLQTFLSGVIVFFFGVTQSVWRCGAMSASNDENVVVAVVNDFLDELDLFLVGGREEFDPCGYAIHLGQDLDDGTALFN